MPATGLRIREGTLTTDVSPAIVYSPGYDIHFFGLERVHPFDGRKFSRAFSLLRRQFGKRLAAWVVAPDAGFGREDLLRVHTAEYLDQVTSPARLACILEVPVAAALPGWLLERRILEPMRLATAGTLTATRHALGCGMAINLGGGYHHASASQG